MNPGLNNGETIINSNSTTTTTNAAVVSDLFTDQQMIDEKKTICFVIADEEILFSKQTLITHSLYISNLV